MNRKECILTIKKIIPDDELRHMIFSSDDIDEDEFLCSRPLILKYFSSILNVAFLFVYLRYKKWKEVNNKLDVCSDNDTPNNFVRVFSELDKIYRDNILSFDIIENILVDIQLDIVVNGAISKELGLINKIVKNDNFSTYAQKAKNARKSSRLDEQITIQERYDELIDLLRTFPFIRDLSIIKNKIENVFYFSSGTIGAPINDLYNIIIKYDALGVETTSLLNDSIDSQEILICKGDMYFCMERLEIVDNKQKKCHIIIPTYWLIGSFKENVSIYICNSPAQLECYDEGIAICYSSALEDYLCSAFCWNTENDDNDGDLRIKNFYAINYKYIKNLALSISDVLDDNGKREICDSYGSLYGFVFGESGVIFKRNNKNLNYTWSEVITLIMIEEGTTNFLSFLIKKKILKKNNLLENLEFRFGHNLFSKSDIENKIKLSVDNLIRQFGTNTITDNVRHIYSRERLEQVSEIEARTIIIGISKAINGNDLKEFPINFPMSIRSKKMLLEEIKSSDIDANSKFEMSKRIVLETFKTLYVFYSSFFEYASVKKEFDDESFYRSLKLDEISRYQKRANEKFASCAVLKLNQLSDSKYDSLGILMKEFIDFCHSCESNHQINNPTSHQADYQTYLKDMLGKSKIIDTSTIEYLQYAFESEIEINDESVNELISKVCNTFTYLQQGKTKNSNVNLGVIFPYVATCEYTNVSRDGNEVYHFTIITPTGRERDFRVLSEFSYELNQKYYLLPNKLCSDAQLNLWIEPIIINYQDIVLKRDE